MEVEMKNTTGERDKYFVDPQSGIVRKVGYCRIRVVEIENFRI
jgi:hypothetical protein